MRKLEFLIGRTSFFLKYNSQLKCITARRIIFLSTIYVYIVLYASRNLLFLPSTCFRSDVHRKAREPRVSICRGRLRVACIDQTVRTFSPVRPIEPGRSANPKYDCKMFISILNRDRGSFIGSLSEFSNLTSVIPVHKHILIFLLLPSFLRFSNRENNRSDRNNTNLKKYTIHSSKQNI